MFVGLQAAGEGNRCKSRKTNHSSSELGHVIYDARTVEIASHTLGIMRESVPLLIRNWYLRLVYVSPVARKRSVTASCSAGEMAFLIFVSLFLKKGYTLSRALQMLQGLNADNCCSVRGLPRDRYVNDEMHRPFPSSKSTA